ncbi:MULTISPECIES: aldo/keto reductase [Anaerotruncus]|jgi:aryl-alcohol dehydrogenase-like predicted oxidoreductase|uniref:aldo/keto reductase n=1 Tax=Anaerotruncus TaxID=244127 RepID=UPI00082B5CD3|nr:MULTISPECIES: aldo/keto reductase [Anaerotruncus]RGX54835.1 aldo/keto reductase [Anaerotruncus sp. AF02-27]
MKYIPLGKTGIEISVLGMGGHEYLPTGKSRGFNEDFSKSTTPGVIFDGFGNENRLKVLKESYDLGINFYDVTQDSEKEALGRNLKQMPPPREIYIQTRPEGMVYTYDENNVKMGNLELLRAEAQRILKLLQRDTIDFFNIAPMKCAFDNDPEYLEKLGRNIAALKQEGLIRFACADTFSGEETYLKMIESGYFDVVYINYNFADYQANRKVLKAAKEQGMGVVDREAYMKGQLFHMAKEAGITETGALADAALRWCLAQDGIDMVVYGTGKPHHLRSAAEAFDKPFTEADQKLIGQIKTTKLYQEYESAKTAEFLQK